MKILDSMKSRLSSISPSAMERLPAAVQKLLTVDMPALIMLVELMEEKHDTPQTVRCD